MLRVYGAFLLLLALPTGVTAATASLNFVQLSPSTIEVQAWVNPVDGDVTGIAGFDFEVLGVPATDISWHPAKHSAYDLASGKQFGFAFMISGVIGNPETSLRYSVGAAQNPLDPSTNIHGIGIDHVTMPHLSTPLNWDPVVVLGTINSTSDLSYANFTGPRGIILYPSAGGNPIAPSSLGILYNGSPFPTWRDLRPNPSQQSPTAPVIPPEPTPDLPPEPILEPPSDIHASPGELDQAPTLTPLPLPPGTIPLTGGPPPLIPNVDWTELPRPWLDQGIDGSPHWAGNYNGMMRLYTTSSGFMPFGDSGVLISAPNNPPSDALWVSVPEPMTAAVCSLLIAPLAYRIYRRRVSQSPNRRLERC